MAAVWRCMVAVAYDSKLGWARGWCGFVWKTQLFAFGVIGCGCLLRSAALCCVLRRGLVSDIKRDVWNSCRWCRGRILNVGMYCATPAHWCKKVFATGAITCLPMQPLPARQRRRLRGIGLMQTGAIRLRGGRVLRALRRQVLALVIYRCSYGARRCNVASNLRTHCKRCWQMRAWACKCKPSRRWPRWILAAGKGSRGRPCQPMSGSAGWGILPTTA